MGGAYEGVHPPLKIPLAEVPSVIFIGFSQGENSLTNSPEHVFWKPIPLGSPLRNLGRVLAGFRRFKFP